MKSCSFFGHRNTEATVELCAELRKTLKRLIEEKGVQIFLFGSKSKFNDLCLQTVRELKKEYSKIILVYVRSQYPYIQQDYKKYLLESYDDTLIPSGIENAGKASYVERNQAMIKASDFCVFYFDENYKPPIRKQGRGVRLGYQPKSGTRLAYDYAKQKNKEIVNLYTEKMDWKESFEK